MYFSHAFQSSGLLLSIANEFKRDHMNTNKKIEKNPFNYCLLDHFCLEGKQEGPNKALIK